MLSPQPIIGQGPPAYYRTPPRAAELRYVRMTVIPGTRLDAGVTTLPAFSPAKDLRNIIGLPALLGFGELIISWQDDLESAQPKQSDKPETSG